MLRTEKLNKRLGSFSLREITLEVSAGDYYVLLGRSGAGKTQLLELICGLTTPDSGHIFLDGEEITYTKGAAERYRSCLPGFCSLPPLYRP